METRNPIVTGATLAITLVLINAACAVVVMLWPDQVISLANAIAHGLDFSTVKATTPMALGRFLYGLVGVGAIGFITGAVYAAVYNVLNRTSRRSTRVTAVSS